MSNLEKQNNTDQVNSAAELAPNAVYARVMKELRTHGFQPKAGVEYRNDSEASVQSQEYDAIQSIKDQMRLDNDDYVDDEYLHDDGSNRVYIRTNTIEEIPAELIISLKAPISNATITLGKGEHTFNIYFQDRPRVHAANTFEYEQEPPLDMPYEERIENPAYRIVSRILTPLGFKDAGLESYKKEQIKKEQPKPASHNRLRRFLSPFYTTD